MRYLALILIVILSGCTTIHFDNGNVDNGGSEVINEQWHHIMALDLYELSDPVSLEQSCKENSWSSVKTELTFLNGLASFGGNLLAPIWYPKTVTVHCEE